MAAMDRVRLAGLLGIIFVCAGCPMKFLPWLAERQGNYLAASATITVVS
jgi:hypothetical protein